ncbi:MAG: S-layer homology domain-containing protein, partial [Monoglobaceae bacterium]
MKNKFTLCSLALSMIFATPCAAETVFYEPSFLSDGYVSIEGRSDVKNGQIAFKAARVGETLEYVSIQETISDGDGNFKFLFRIPEQINGASSNGTYSVFVTAKDEARREAAFDYINFEYILKRIKATESGAELYAILNNSTAEDKAALEVMGMAVAELEDISSRLSSITDEWFKLCDLKNAEAAEAADSFNRAMGLEYARLGNAETALKLINPVYEGVEFESAENKTELARAVKNNMDAESLEKFCDAYVLANKIIRFRELRAVEFVEAIQTYDKYFNFSGSSKYSSYISMNLTKQGRVADNMSQLINSDTVKVSEIVSAFESAVKAVEASNATTGGSSGGGGGGSSSGGTGSYSSGATVSEYQVEKAKEYTEGFSDLTGAEWAIEAITALAGKGIVSGSGDGKFNPNDSVTREEFTKMTILAIRIYDGNAECDFSDVSRDEWYYSY